MSVIARLERAAFGYGREPVLSEFSCELRAGEFVGLVGPNGSGKTTFLRGLLGLLPPLSGRVERDGSRRFAYVPQAEELNLSWPLTIRETVELAARARSPFGRLSEEDRRRAGEGLARVGLEGIAGRLLRDASGGQRQRAMLAQALSLAPDALLLDEPTRGLDVVAERDFLDLIGTLRAEGRTVLLVTHSLAIPLNRATRILLFNAGRVHDATPDELMRPGRLEEIYGVPFHRHENAGERWVAPAPAR